MRIDAGRTSFIEKTDTATSLPKTGRVERYVPASALTERISLSEIAVFSGRVEKPSHQSDKYSRKNRGCPCTARCLRTCTGCRDPAGFPVQKPERTLYAAGNTCPQFAHLTPGSRSKCEPWATISGQNRDSGPIRVDFATRRFLKKQFRTIRDFDSQVSRESQ